MLSGSHVKDSTPGGLVVRRKWLIESESPNLKWKNLNHFRIIGNIYSSHTYIIIVCNLITML